jgi:hypothetical protein
VVMLIDRDLNYEFKVCSNTGVTGWGPFTEAMPFTISSKAVTARNFSTFEKKLSIMGELILLNLIQVSRKSQTKRSLSV